MRKVFWDNPYASTLETKIAAVRGNEVLLDETIAYSFSGGQESDKGFINEMPILDSRKEGVLIYYTMPEGHGLNPGQFVTMTIDWARRYRLMRLHFAAELVLEIVTQKFHLKKVGAHISESKSRIDFVSSENISALFPAILEAYNDIIKKDLVIETGFTDVATQRRFWRIEGFAEVACGGTHVKSTGEVGFVALKRTHPGKMIERIEIKLLDDGVVEK
ncbi:MAG: alanyl-tRNA editing protein [Verrucomicrobia bacterium]|nr:MAG: alanyl-tRNA editing protein [Verrucomicrobiota bacterium]